MLLGIDVGGTHTDAVLIGNEGIIRTFKTATDHENLLGSITTALRTVTSDIDLKKIRNINLSTTLSTNAIVEEKLEKTGLFISSGPGIDPASFAMGDFTFIIPGSIDHRGVEKQKLDKAGIEKCVKSSADSGLKVFAAVTKFSTRNSSHEEALADAAGSMSDFTTKGYRLSGQLSFPRRVATAYYNSAVWRLYNKFTDAVMQGIGELGIEAPVNILKADGGTMPVAVSREIPVESILSGPAASIMGIVALCSIDSDSVILDVGGTTTDIAVFASGAPLIEREGIRLGVHPTLVRSLQNRSIGIGGDSLLTVRDGKVTAGPERKGPAAAEGGKDATLIDALNLLGTADFGDRSKSVKAVTDLAADCKMKPEKLAEEALHYAVESIRAAIDGLLDEINQKPVYTIHEMIEGKTIRPETVYMIGGPASSVAKIIGGNIKTMVPENSEVANAIGAALARTTIEADLFADTGTGKMIMPSLGVEKPVDRKYSLKQAEEEAAEHLADFLRSQGIEADKSDIDIMSSSSFRMIDSFFSSGDDLRVRCQIKPGVTMNLYK